MARNADLRPRGRAGRTTASAAFASRALPLAVFLLVAAGCIHR